MVAAGDGLFWVVASCTTSTGVTAMCNRVASAVTASSVCLMTPFLCLGKGCPVNTARVERVIDGLACQWTPMSARLLHRVPKRREFSLAIGKQCRGIGIGRDRTKIASGTNTTLTSAFLRAYSGLVAIPYRCILPHDGVQHGPLFVTIPALKIKKKTGLSPRWQAPSRAKRVLRG